MIGKSYEKKLKGLILKIKDLMEQEESCEVKLRIVKGNLSSKIELTWKVTKKNLTKQLIQQDFDNKALTGKLR